MKRIQKLAATRAIKALKPRNPVLAAVKNNPGMARDGAHGKTHSAVRRAEKVALALDIVSSKK